MKSKIFSVLQRIGRSFMLPIAILPIAGLFLGIGSCFTNEAMITSLHLESILGNGTFLYNILQVMTKVGSVVFTNLPLIFAASVALGMAKKEKEVATLSAIIAFFIMHATINGMLITQGKIVDNQVAAHVLEGTIVNVCGIQSLEMGVFGGIIVGLGVGYLHNRFYRIELPNVLSFFEGSRFVPIISAVVFFLVGTLMYYLWPFVQVSIFSVGSVIANSGYFGTFIYGVIKRLLVPFGLHHVFYLPFWQTAIGGAMEINGTMIYGGQNIFFAQLADPSTVHFSSEATRYFSGEFIFMIFGLPGAALAMYHCAKVEHKKVVGGLLLSATLTCVLTGITEPIEFSFLFVAPMLFGVQMLLAGSAYMVAHMLNIAVGLTFSGGLIDFLEFGVMQGNSKTTWILIIPVGILYFILYYGSFKFLIKRYDLKTIGRGSEDDIPEMRKHKTITRATPERSLEYVIDQQAAHIVRGLGGRDNFSEIDSCITRLRVTLQDSKKVNEGKLKEAGAAAIVMQGNGLQIIFGPKASSIKTNLEEYLANTTISEDEEEYSEGSYDILNMELGNIVDGEVMPIEASCDRIFSQKLIGDGVMIKPHNGLIVAPCDARVTMIYPTNHAIGLELDNGSELLIHFGTDTVKLNGQGFTIFVKLNQRIKKGDLLWNADIAYISEHATCENILMVFTKLGDTYKIDKTYGNSKRGANILTIHQ